MQNKGDYRTLLRQCIFNILTKSLQFNMQTVSIPAISSGIFGYPKPLCAFDIIQALLDFARGRLQAKKGNPIEELKVRLTNFDDETVNCFKDAFKERFDGKYTE